MPVVARFSSPLSKGRWRGAACTPTMAGRPLTEAFRDGPDLAAEPRSSEIGQETPDGRYRAVAQSTVVLGRRYLDSATAERP